MATHKAAREHDGLVVPTHAATLRQSEGIGRLASSAAAAVVFVNDRKADEIATDPFPAVKLDSDEYFVLGDNRSFSQDSRHFGPGATGRDRRPCHPRLLAVRTDRRSRLRQEPRATRRCLLQLTRRYPAGRSSVVLAGPEPTPERRPQCPPFSTA